MLPRLWLLVGSDRPRDRQTMSLIELSWTAKKMGHLIWPFVVLLYQTLQSMNCSKIKIWHFGFETFASFWRVLVSVSENLVWNKESQFWFRKLWSRSSTELWTAVYNLFTIQTAPHCINCSVYAYTYCGRKVLEHYLNGLRSSWTKCWMERVTGRYPSYSKVSVSVLVPRLLPSFWRSRFRYQKFCYRKKLLSTSTNMWVAHRQFRVKIMIEC